MQRASQLPAAATDGDMTWQDKGACFGTWQKDKPDLWFPPDNPGGPKRGKGVLGEAERIRRARAVCHRCNVRSRCLKFALNNNLTGVWGATTDAERRFLKLDEEIDESELVSLQLGCREKEETDARVRHAPGQAQGRAEPQREAHQLRRAQDARAARQRESIPV